MSMTNPSARARAILEEELGEFRAFQGLSAAEIEAMAARLVRALEPVIAAAPEARRSAA